MYDEHQILIPVDDRSTEYLESTKDDQAQPYLNFMEYIMLRNDYYHYYCITVDIPSQKKDG